ncbi:probable U3 small nucleolar RNA-associated protein 11 [Primulina eburnea]|uniref:probable U3 small nucleolar RNA-associated protein 11 n=1 Tax=Primulina eburnea TaxID=1245227 RepID=UPI003C6C4008
MSSLRNAIPRKAHKERAQPHLRRKFGLLEKHKDYVIRARAYHQKEHTLLKLKEKAALRNPYEFYFKMIKTKTVGGVHKPESQANKYTNEELMLMKTQDIGYILQKLQTEKKKIERINGMLHSLDNQSSSKHVYYAENREEAREVRKKVSEQGNPSAFKDLPKFILRVIILIIIGAEKGIKMSSLRNAIPRKAHNERAQPHLIRKFGLLEKHKDYVIRARAYHQKEQTLLKLKEKAALRNPDEFYF